MIAHELRPLCRSCYYYCYGQPGPAGAAQRFSPGLAGHILVAVLQSRSFNSSVMVRAPVGWGGGGDILGTQRKATLPKEKGEEEGWWWCLWGLGGGGDKRAFVDGSLRR